jgi:hypothetical protein
LGEERVDILDEVLQSHVVESMLTALDASDEGASEMMLASEFDLCT